MFIRAYLQFYKDIIPFTLVFTLISSLIFGIISAFILFLTIGVLIGFLAFSLLSKNEFYFYYNLGLNKWKLFKAVFLLNLIIGAPIILLLLIIAYYFIGNISII